MGINTKSEVPSRTRNGDRVLPIGFEISNVNFFFKFVKRTIIVPFRKTIPNTGFVGIINYDHSMTGLLLVI